ncbi:MAG: zf-HC2 domain-containing protein [Rhodovulum sp.]
MLKCNEVAARASDLIDGELTGWQAIQMRLHLAMCKGCNNFIGQLRTTRDLTEAAAQEATEEYTQDPRLTVILAHLRDDRRDA